VVTVQTLQVIRTSKQAPGVPVDPDAAALQD
jgi:hypothetical protein